MSKTFIDTNILIYAMDQAEPVKQKQSRLLLKEINAESHSGVISTQILQEFYVITTKKLNLDPLLIKSIMLSFENYEVVTIHAGLIQAAIDCSILNRVSFWDALVIVSAESACCDRLLSEDLNHGQIIRGVKIENPFIKSNLVNETHGIYRGD
jgi:predicted nucleic acid-binding protein